MRELWDMREVVYWEDILDIVEGELNMVYQVNNESIVVPENVDAIRALTDVEADWKASVDDRREPGNNAHISIKANNSGVSRAGAPLQRGAL